METRFRFRHVNELTGLFVLAVLALVIAGVVFTGQSQRWFARQYSFDVRLPESGAFGLRRGNEVFIAGVSVGLVDDIRVGLDRRMKAQVKVRSDFERFVRVDSTAVIKKVFGVAGDSFMEITRGEGAPLPEHHTEIECVLAEELPARIERILEEVRAELVPVVKTAGLTFTTWSELGSDLRLTQAKLNRLFVRLDGQASGLEEGNGTAGKLLRDSALADEAQILLGRANDSMSEWRGLLTNLNETVRIIELSAARFPEITEALANEAKDLPGLIDQTQNSMREVQRLVEALQRHWLFRSYVNKTNPPPRLQFPVVGDATRKLFVPVRSPRDSK